MPENTSEKQRVNFKRIDLAGKNSIIPSAESSMRSSRNIIISAAIILITVLVGGYLLITKKDSLINKGNSTDLINTVGLKFSDKNYKLDYSSVDPETVLTISGFENNEGWQGKSEFDDVYFWDGDFSLVLTSRNDERLDVFLDKDLNLEDYSIFKMSVYLQTDPADVELTRLYFSDKDKNSYYYYSIRNLVKGWNQLTIPKNKFSTQNVTGENQGQTEGTGSSGRQNQLSWQNIARVGLEVASRANSTTDINFDSLKALKNEDYLDDWLVNSPMFLDLSKANNNIYLQGKHFGAAVALLKKLSGITDFTYSAKLQPLRNNTRSGLFVRGDFKTGYGYYFMIDGVNGNRYQIFKIHLEDGKTVNTVIKNGVINNFIVEKDTPLWLKVEGKGNAFKYSLSTDGKSYSELASVKDSQYKEGGLGISVYDQGATLFDEFRFSR